MFRSTVITGKYYNYHFKHGHSYYRKILRIEIPLFDGVHRARPHRLLIKYCGCVIGKI